MSNVQVRETQIKQGLLAQQKIVKSLLGDKTKSDKFLATAVKVASDYKLRECHTDSIIDACVNVAQMGLDLSPTLSHAYLVPFKSKKDAKVASVQLIVSARGYTALLSRTGWKVKTYIVNESDDFEYIIEGFKETIKFEKDIDSTENKFKYAVALAQSPDGTLYVEVMNKGQIDKHRMVSSNQNSKTPSGVWAEWFDEMAKKTVLKKLVKTLPIGEDIAFAVDVDDKPIETEVIENKQVEVDTNPTYEEVDAVMPNINPKTGEYEDLEIEVQNNG